MKVGDEYVSYYRPLSFVNMTITTTFTTITLINDHPIHLETLVVHPAILRYRKTQGDLTIGC